MRVPSDPLAAHPPLVLRVWLALGMAVGTTDGLHPSAHVRGLAVPVGTAPAPPAEGLPVAVEAGMTEAELQAGVERLLDAAGVAWHHCPRSERCRGTPGWPDIVAFGAVPFAWELKSGDGRRSRAQIATARKIVQAGADCRLWRPEHYDSGEIAAELEKLA